MWFELVVFLSCQILIILYVVVQNINLTTNKSNLKLTCVRILTLLAAPFHLSLVTNVFRKIFFLCMRNDT